MSLTPILRTHRNAEWGHIDHGFINLPINCIRDASFEWPWTYWVGWKRMSISEIAEVQKSFEHPPSDIIEVHSDINLGGIYRQSTSFAETLVSFAYIATDPIPITIYMSAECFYGEAATSNPDPPLQGRSLFMQVRLVDPLRGSSKLEYDWMGNFVYQIGENFYYELPATAGPKILYVSVAAAADMDASTRVHITF